MNQKKSFSLQFNTALRKICPFPQPNRLCAQGEKSVSVKTWRRGSISQWYMSCLLEVVGAGLKGALFWLMSDDFIHSGEGQPGLRTSNAMLGMVLKA